MTSPVIEEATKLAAALADWAKERGPGAVGLAVDAIGSHVGGSQQCTLCPVCQVLDLVRNAQPEVFEHLAEAASSLTAAITALVESAASRPAGGPPRVQHIDIT